MIENLFPLHTLVVLLLKPDEDPGSFVALLWFGDRFWGHVLFGSNIINLSFIRFIYVYNENQAFFLR